jgi:hypothetical protein
MDELGEFMKVHRSLTKSLMVPVMIDHEQVCKIVVEDLIAKRNSPSNKIRTEFDAVLRYYLTEDEFERYVVRLEKIEV